jgi:GcrA cell cycle regulator
MRFPPEDMHQTAPPLTVEQPEPPAPIKVAWTEERVERLKTLLADGLSCSEIAAELGGVTRNAVIGKIHRHGWHMDRKPGGPFGDVNGARKAALKRQLSNKTFLFGAGVGADVLLATVAGDSVLEKPVHGLTLLELEIGQCKWPSGGPREPDFLFCGDEALSGFPYCAGHARLAYVLPRRRR